MAEKKKIEQKPIKSKHPPYLKHAVTGRIYPYHPITAKRGDMLPYYGDIKK